MVAAEVKAIPFSSLFPVFLSVLEWVCVTFIEEISKVKITEETWRVGSEPSRGKSQAVCEESGQRAGPCHTGTHG